MENGAESFRPKESEEITVGRYHAQVYPKVTTEMPDHECAFAYHQTSSALRLLKIEPAQYLDTLGLRLGTSTIVESHKYQWLRHLDKNWCNMNHLTILSFHNSSGTAVNDACLPGTMILKPFTDGLAANARRPADIRFVRLRLRLDYRPLMTADQDNHVLDAHYYIELPQESRELLNSQGNAFALTTFFGADNLALLSVEDIKRDILSHVPYSDPIDLKEAAFNVTTATVDATEIRLELERRVTKLAIPTIEKKIFASLCPGYSMEPDAVLDTIKQYHKDKDGNIIRQSFREYYNRFMVAVRPFSTMDTMPVDVCAIVIRNMHPDMKASFKEVYPKYADAHDRASDAQMNALAEIQKQGFIAEGKIKTIQGLVSSATGQTFHSDVAGYASQAERTLTQYQNKKEGEDAGGSSPEGKRVRLCDGCGEPDHLYAFRGKITCPNAAKPGVFERAQQNKAKREKAMAKRGSSSRWSKREPDFKDLNKKARKKMIQQVLASFSQEGDEEDESEDEKTRSGAGRGKSLKSPRGSPKSTGAGGGAGRGKSVYQFLYDVIDQDASATVLQHGTPRSPLPVVINPMLPHIPVVFGLSLEDENSPTVMCVVDTAAALTTGNLFFVTKLAKMFPHCVAKISTADDYAPVTLTGIVRSDVDGTKTSTELPVAFTFHLPYAMTDGAPTNITIGCGPDVSVNVILGWPFIQATQMVIDAAECVAECRALDCEPFPIENRRARVDVPNATVPTNESTANHADLLQELEALESHWACVYAIDPATGEKKMVSKKRVVTSGVEKQPVSATAAGDSGAARVSFAPEVNGVIDNYYDPAMGAEDNDEEE